MTGGADLLHDPQRLAAADGARLLPAVATAGAQVRAAGGQLADALPTGFDRPRALVVAGQHTEADTAVLRALAGPRAPAPIIAAERLPAWVGALDVVVVLAVQRHDQVAAEAADLAARRGATVVVRCAADEPVPGPAIAVPPSVSVPEAVARPARLALLTGVAHRCGLLAPVDLSRWADTLDAAALACHPRSEGFVNPAVTIAEHLLDGTPVLVGTDPVCDALAGCAVASLAELAGVGAAVLDVGTALRSVALLRRTATRPDPFADPVADESTGPPRQKALLLSLDPNGPATSALSDAVPTAPVIGPDTSRPDTDEGAHTDRSTAAVQQLLQWDFAAVYLGLAAGQLPPPDAPDGLGRPGTALGDVRAEEVAAPVRIDQEEEPWTGFGVFDHRDSGT